MGQPSVRQPVCPSLCVAQFNMIVIQALYDTEELHWPHAVAVAVGIRALIQQLALVLFDDSNQTHHQSQRGTQTSWRRTQSIVVVAAVVSAAVTLQFAAACTRACHNRRGSFA